MSNPDRPDPKLWTLDTGYGEVDVMMDPKPFAFRGAPGEGTPMLELGISDDLGYRSVPLDARQAWSLGEHLRDAAAAYLDAKGQDG